MNLPNCLLAVYFTALNILSLCLCTSSSPCLECTPFTVQLSPGTIFWWAIFWFPLPLVISASSAKVFCICFVCIYICTFRIPRYVSSLMARTLSLWSLYATQSLARCLPYSRYLINTCWYDSWHQKKVYWAHPKNVPRRDHVSIVWWRKTDLHFPNTRCHFQVQDRSYTILDKRVHNYFILH